MGPYWTLYALTLRQHVRGKRWMVLSTLFLLPAGLAILIRFTAPEAPLPIIEFLLAMMFIPQALLPLLALLYASGIIQDEQEEQTITYLLIRPMPKWAIYLIKLVAAMTTSVSLSMFFTALTFVAIYAGGANTPDDVWHRCCTVATLHALAVVAYCSLFGLMSMFTRRTLIAGILYTALVEGLLANLPFGIRLGTVIYYTRIIAYRSLDFKFQRRHGGTEDLAAAAWQFDLKKDPSLLEHPQFDTCVTVLIVGSIASAALAALMCMRQEFHVKTPEAD